MSFVPVPAVFSRHCQKSKRWTTNSRGSQNTRCLMCIPQNAVPATAPLSNDQARSPGNTEDIAWQKHTSKTHRNTDWSTLFGTFGSHNLQKKQNASRPDSHNPMEMSSLQWMGKMCDFSGKQTITNVQLHVTVIIYIYILDVQISLLQQASRNPLSDLTRTFSACCLPSPAALHPATKPNSPGAIARAQRPASSSPLLVMR